MRVIAGTAKGRRLRAPRGTSVRPTSDLIREAIFDMVAARDHDLGRTLDLYAGTGAMGIEALSRGATHVDFVERDSRCCAAIAHNLRAVGLEAPTTVHCQPVEQALRRLSGSYDTIFVDAPYADPDLEGALTTLADSALVGEEAVLVVEHSRRRQLADGYGGLRRAAMRRHGDSCISIYTAGG